MTSDAMAARHGNRLVIDYATGRPGPCLVAFGGLHGDEPAGIRALERVRDILEVERPQINGRFIAVLGNLSAIAAGRRYLDQDLNRNWFEEAVEELRARDPSGDSPEDAERRALIELLDHLETAPQYPFVFVDLHSTSAEGLPFCCMPDTVTNLKIALQLPFPAILGLEDTIRGPLMGLLSDRGFACVIVEGGQHQRPRTADILEATVWVLLARLSLIRRVAIPRYREHWRCLMHAGRDLPRVLDVRYQHETRAGDGFLMEPGFEHYDRVSKGQVLARDHSGEVCATMNARIIMPAYKPGTDQGFFLARDVAWYKVRILFLLRRLNLGNFAHLLPGARVLPDNRNVLEVAGWVPNRLVSVIRLLGWRRTHRDHERTLLRRRRVRVKSEALKVERRATPR